jgi:hypothetical protein
MTQLALSVAAAQQLLLAVLFFVIPFVALRFGQGAQRAAEQSVAAQGIDIDAETLLRNGARFVESEAEMLLPLGIGAILVIVAWLNLTQRPLARPITWAVEALLLLVVGLVTAAQVFPAPYVKRAWARSDDERLRRIDVTAMMSAAGGAFPWWLRPLQLMRFFLATVGSLVVMGLLLA